MPYDNATPDLTGLGSDYQILTELHRTADSRTYLARHLGLKRDVTITVFTGAADMPHLAQFAADTEHLTTLRHPNVVPVLEGRWLNDRSYAVVRARVRGSTLDQLISAGGRMPEPRVRAAMQELASAIVWARMNGITHRHVSPDSLMFQQGSGRVLVSLDPSAQPVSDEQTIRHIATAMVGQTPDNIGEYVAMLGETPLASEAAVAAAVPEAVPVIATAPSGTGDVVVVQRGSSFNSRLISTIVVLAALAFAAVLFARHRGSDTNRVAVNVTDSTRGAAGDVAPRGWDTTMNSTPAYTQPQPTIVSPPPPPVSVYPAAPQPQSVQPMPMAQPMPRPMPAQPMPAQPTPAQPTPAQAMPATQPPPRIDTVARTPAPTSGDICDSPAAPDQHRCLMNAIDNNDRELNGVYQQLITALRKQAAVADGDADPQTVADLRAAQRRWLQDRDDACHSAGSGPLYARDRAACFADRTAARVSDLKSQLSGVHTPADTSGAPPFRVVLQFDS